MTTALPACGLYITTVAIGGVPEGRLVYFHNHGNPGPGVYLPKSWQGNRVVWSEQGTTLPSLDLAETLERLPAEGLYRVVSAFHCCAKKCTEFRPEQLVQLGYQAGGQALVFVPRWAGGALELPSRGVAVDREALGHLSRLEVPSAAAASAAGEAAPAGTVLH